MQNHHDFSTRSSCPISHQLHRALSKILVPAKPNLKKIPYPFSTPLIPPLHSLQPSSRVSSRLSASRLCWKRARARDSAADWLAVPPRSVNCARFSETTTSITSVDTSLSRCRWRWWCCDGKSASWGDAIVPRLAGRELISRCRNYGLRWSCVTTR